MDSQDELKSLPTRAYLDETIVPMLMQGLSALVQANPPRPLEYLGKYLLNSDSAALQQPEETENEMASGGQMNVEQTTRGYLAANVDAVLVQGIQKIVDERPDNPLQTLGYFLLDHAE